MLIPDDGEIIDTVMQIIAECDFFSSNALCAFEYRSLEERKIMARAMMLAMPKNRRVEVFDRLGKISWLYEHYGEETTQ